MIAVAFALTVAACGGPGEDPDEQAPRSGAASGTPFDVVDGTADAPGTAPPDEVGSTKVEGNIDGGDESGDGTSGGAVAGADGIVYCD